MSKSSRPSYGWRKIKKILAKTGGRCFYCGCVLPPDTDNLDEYGVCYSSIRNWDVDHLIPVSKGGNGKVENLVPSCKSCNHNKSDKLVDEFIGAR